MMNEELTLRDIAGFCPEEAVWRMLVDTSDILVKEKSGYKISADTIAVVGKQFMVTGEKTQTTMAEMVWALGATAYYAATGHVVFGGHGLSYQQAHPHVALPVLPKSFQALTEVIHQCLCYEPTDRISLEQLKQTAERGLAACSKQHRMKRTPINKPTKEKNHQGDNWPEEMIEV